MTQALGGLDTASDTVHQTHCHEKCAASHTGSDIARGSITEVQSLLYVALDVGYLKKSEFDKLRQITEKTASLISGLTAYLRKRPQS